MSESENHQPEENVSIGNREKIHSSHGIGAVIKQRPAVMEPLKVICNTSNAPTEGEVGLTNGLQNDTHKYQTPPVSPKQKEPRAKMSLSPNKTSTKLVNQTVDLAKAGIKRGYARKTMTPDRVLGSVKIKSAMKPSPSNDSISTSPASSREGSVESFRSSVDNRSLDGSASSRGNRENNNNVKTENESNTDDARSEASSARSSPAKFPPRARKSLPKAGSSVNLKVENTSKPKGQMTFKITDFANKLGLHGQSLAKVDAKTLDNLIMKARKKDMSRNSSPVPNNKEKEKLHTPVNTNATKTTVNTPTALIEENRIPKASDVEDDAVESGRSTPIRLRGDSPSRAKKKKKRKSGTYSLPSEKKVIKKKKADGIVRVTDKPGEGVVVIEDDADENGVMGNEVDGAQQHADVACLSESMDTDDKDTGLSDETGSEKGYNIQKKKKMKSTLARGGAGNKKVVSSKALAGSIMNSLTKKLGTAKSKPLSAEDRIQGSAGNDEWMTCSETEDTPKKPPPTSEETEIDKPLSRKRKASDASSENNDRENIKPEVAALKKLRKEDGVPPNKVTATENSTLMTSPKPNLPMQKCVTPNARPLNTFPTLKQQLRASPQHVKQQHVPQDSKSSGELALAKYHNTPNGLTYPVVTPPDTPDNSLAQIPTQLGNQKTEDIPLCCCKIDGTKIEYQGECTYCQALDSIDGKVVGCCSKVSNLHLVRPAVKIPFMAVCEIHRKRLQLHQICPGCGQFCSQGKFLQCKAKLGSIAHLYHRQCQVFRDGKYHCPHCGQESAQTEVTLKMNEPRKATMFVKEFKEPDKPPLGPRAKIGGTSTRPVLPETKPEDKETDNVLKIKSSNITLSAVGLPFGPSRKELEQSIELLATEKPKRYRSGPKSLFVAARNNEMERVLYLLAEGADPNTKCEENGGQTALHAATTNGNLAIAHLLVQARAVPNVLDDSLRTPLMNCAEKGFLDIVQFLVRVGAVLDSRAEDGMTCLHLAAQNGKINVVKFLVETRRIDVNIRDDGGWSAIIWAAEFRHVEVVRYLLEAGANPNLRDNEENTGLHWASYAGSVDIAELLLNAGCEIEAVNEHGDRPLHIAGRQNHYECVVLFLARGATCDARNNENETPLTCCVDQKSKVYMALSVNNQLKEFAAKRLKRPEKLLHRDISMGKEQYGVPVVNDIDDENYPTDFQYVIENIETTPMNVNRTITSLQHCECRDDCSSLFCKCTRSSVQCWYDKEGKLVRDFNTTEPPLIFECNKACSCWANCHNRVVQLGITCRLQVFRTLGRGWGCRTLLDIPQGAFVCEYIGEHISDAEADSREDDSYLFDLDNKDTDTFCIDARKYGNVSRFINHLCEPNIIPVKVFIEHQDLRFPRICFFASREIKAGEELGFDYGEKFWIIKWKQFTCACGSPKCKYSSETIHLTIADFERRQREEDVMDVVVP